MIQLRPYQQEISDKAISILKKRGIVYLALEVRTGKTLTSLSVASGMNAKHVLFVTKKKAISSIESDYKLLSPNYGITVTNFESVHKVEKNFDLVVIDEAHSLGAFPKTSKRTKAIKTLVGNLPLILLSGTPTPESWSQVYHQFWISGRTPFPENTFYKWAKVYVDIKEKFVAHGNKVNDYSAAKEKLVRQAINPYMISFTQKEAGFNSSVDEEILIVRMSPSTYNLARIIEKDNVFTGKNGGVILADTGAKVMQKLHQIWSGSVILEDGSVAITDYSKGNFIKERFSGNKIAIFYKFKGELQMLKEVFGDQLTEDLDEFNNSSKNIALQIQAGREGISLKAADYLIFVNIDFSAVSYFQARNRLQTKERTHNKVYWIFAKGGIEQNIYRTVLAKKNYTLKHFNHDRIQVPEEAYQPV